MTLRASDYPSALAQQVEAIQGVAGRCRAPQQLAPSKSFARALLGTVGPATAEQIQRSKGKVGARRRRRPVRPRGALPGPAGRHADAPHRHPLAHRRARRDAPQPPGRKGRELRTTLDRPVQAAAEVALGATQAEGGAGGLQPSTGDILAVANRPTDAAYDRAIDGRYAPGSTFKVVTTAALLRAGLKTSDTVACPKTITVSGKLFKNFEGEAAGAVPFARDFAQSCNTAFVSLAKRLAPDALTRHRARLRPRAHGRQPGPARPRRGRARGDDDRPGPHRRQPAGHGRRRGDRRRRALARAAPGGSTDKRQSGPALDQDELSTLRTLMRSVVTSGTGTALAAVPGEVAGKSGTAEYGGGNPPPTHAWFIAFRGDLAVAVLVENGRSGGSVAAPIAARFFQAVTAAQQQAAQATTRRPRPYGRRAPLARCGECWRAHARPTSVDFVGLRLNNTTLGARRAPTRQYYGRASASIRMPAKNSVSASCPCSGSTCATYWSGRTTTMQPVSRLTPAQVEDVTGLRVGAEDLLVVDQAEPALPAAAGPTASRRRRGRGAPAGRPPGRRSPSRGRRPAGVKR